MKQKLTKGLVCSPLSACPECKRKDFRYLRRSGTWYCRICGAEWSRDWVDLPKVQLKGKGAKK